MQLNNNLDELLLLASKISKQKNEILDNVIYYLETAGDESNLMEARQESEFWEDIVEIIDYASHMIESQKTIEEVDTGILCDCGDPGCDFNCDTKEVDMVNSPNHYTQGGIEVIDFIKSTLTEEEFRGYIKGNIIKYISRERFKNGDEDMLKSIFYLNYIMHGVKSDGSK